MMVSRTLLYAGCAGFFTLYGAFVVKRRFSFFLLRQPFLLQFYCSVPGGAILPSRQLIASAAQSETLLHRRFARPESVKARSDVT
jgi:hypothetical protein